MKIEETIKIINQTYKTYEGVSNYLLVKKIIERLEKYAETREDAHG